jgi:hypothetical protein
MTTEDFGIIVEICGQVGEERGIVIPINPEPVTEPEEITASKKDAQEERWAIEIPADPEGDDDRTYGIDFYRHGPADNPIAKRTVSIRGRLISEREEQEAFRQQLRDAIDSMRREIMFSLKSACNGRGDLENWAKRL